MRPPLRPFPFLTRRHSVLDPPLHPPPPPPLFPRVCPPSPILFRSPTATTTTNTTVTTTTAHISVTTRSPVLPSPPSSPSASPSPPPFPRSLTAPVSRLHAGNTPHPHVGPYKRRPDGPVPLSPGLSPSRRHILPHPKPVRPRPVPAQSDLSAASTRAEPEPRAVRDLRRVTAPATLLDPVHYSTPRRASSPGRAAPRLHHRHRHKRHRHSIVIASPSPPRTPPATAATMARGTTATTAAASSASASSVVTDRLSDALRRDRWSLLSDRRPRAMARSPTPKRSPFRLLFRSAQAAVPDRLRDVPMSGGREGRGRGMMREEHANPRRLRRRASTATARAEEMVPRILTRASRSDLHMVEGENGKIETETVEVSSGVANEDESVMSTLTDESMMDRPRAPGPDLFEVMVEESSFRPRPRSLSDPAVVQRRLSLVPTKKRVQSVWERLWPTRRRASGARRGQERGRAWG